MKLPNTTRIKPRPVWRRHLRRQLRNVEPMPPPTEAEKHDAILVLSEPLNAMAPELWAEATRIFEEASL